VVHCAGDGQTRVRGPAQSERSDLFLPPVSFPFACGARFSGCAETAELLCGADPRHGVETRQAAEKAIHFVIPNEVRNLSSI
jgi:hypothetical protein